MDLPDELKKAILAALATGVTPQKIAASSDRETDMKFMLNNAKGQTIEVTAEQLEAAGVKIVKDGETVIPQADLSQMQGTIVTLSSAIETMREANAAQAQAAREAELVGELTRLSKGGFITKPTRDALYGQFKDSTDLSAFKAIAGTFTTPIVSLNREHGSGGKGESSEKTNGEDATEKLINMANTIAKEKGISLRDATIQAGAQMADEAEAYREQFAER
jgi:hypothetical protein